MAIGPFILLVLHPRFHRSPHGRTLPCFLGDSVRVPVLLSFLPRPPLPRLPQDQAASTGFNQLSCAPRERPRGRPLFPPVEFFPLSGYGKQEQGSCRGGVAGQTEGLGICSPALAASLSLFSLSFSNSLNFDAVRSALVFVQETIVAVKRKPATGNHRQRQGITDRDGKSQTETGNGRRAWPAKT